MSNPAPRPVPGTVEVPGREFLYIECAGPAEFAQVFPSLVTGGTAPRPASGGMINEAATIRTPEDRLYAAVSYRGDRAGFRAKLVEWCDATSSRWARIESGRLCCSDGSIFDLSECVVSLA